MDRRGFLKLFAGAAAALTLPDPDRLAWEATEVWRRPRTFAMSPRRGTIPYRLSTGEIVWLWADGEHDDAAGFQRIIDVENAVVLPHGEYRFERQFVADNGVLIDGGGSLLRSPLLLTPRSRTAEQFRLQNFTSQVDWKEYPTALAALGILDESHFTLFGTNPCLELSA